MFPYKSFEKKHGFIPAALVFEAEWINGLALIRGLGEKGIIVYALSSNPKAIGFYSKYVKKHIVHPDPNSNSECFLDFIVKLGKKLNDENQKGVLFPTSDLLVKIFSENKDALKDYFIFTFPDSDITLNCLNKTIQYQKAIESGIHIPKTYFEANLSCLYHDLNAKKISYPLILKASYSYVLNNRKKYRTVLIRNKYELTQILTKVRKDEVSFVIQEVIPGNDDTLYTLGSYMSKDVTFKAIFTGRKLRQKPPRFGICRVGESVYVPKIIHYGYLLLKCLKFFGISQVEFKYDYRDNEFKLMELNPRSWSWIGLPIKMGINIPYVAFCDVLNIDEKPQYMQQKKYIWISIEDDILISFKFADGFPLKHLFIPKNGLYEAYFSLKDPLPWFLHMKEFFRSEIDFFKKLKISRGIERCQN